MYKEILKQMFSETLEYMDFSKLNFQIQSREKKIIDEICQILKKYDNDDFMCVEEIVHILELNGYDCGNCHDF